MFNISKKYLIILYKKINLYFIIINQKIVKSKESISLL